MSIQYEEPRGRKNGQPQKAAPIVGAEDDHSAELSALRAELEELRHHAADREAASARYEAMVE